MTATGTPYQHGCSFGAAAAADIVTSCGTVAAFFFFVVLCFPLPDFFCISYTPMLSSSSLLCRRLCSFPLRLQTINQNLKSNSNHTSSCSSSYSKKGKNRKKEKQQQKQQIQRRSTAFKLLQILENRWELGISLLYLLQITKAATYKKIDALLLSLFFLLFSLSVLLLTRNCTKNSPPS